MKFLVVEWQGRGVLSHDPSSYLRVLNSWTAATAPWSTALMSLSVDVFVVGADGEMQVLDVPAGCSDLAGFERWRTAVWGSEMVRSLGASFFPVLANDDLRVEAQQVQAFLAECVLLRKNLEQIAANTDAVRTVDEHRRLISQRLANIEDAARRAREMGGGVLIW